jgi:hypothetical protein
VSGREVADSWLGGSNLLRITGMGQMDEFMMMIVNVEPTLAPTDGLTRLTIRFQDQIMI